MTDALELDNFGARQPTQHAFQQVNWIQERCPTRITCGAWRALSEDPGRDLVEGHEGVPGRCAGEVLDLKPDRYNPSMRIITIIAMLLVAVSASLVMVGLYSWSVLHSGWRALLVSGMLSGVYGYLYFVLRMEDFASLVPCGIARPLPMWVETEAQDLVVGVGLP